MLNASGTLPARTRLTRTVRVAGGNKRGVGCDVVNGAQGDRGIASMSSMVGLDSDSGWSKNYILEIGATIVA